MLLFSTDSGRPPGKETTIGFVDFSTTFIFIVFCSCDRPIFFLLVFLIITDELKSEVR